jgi:hypothetical protein
VEDQETKVRMRNQIVRKTGKYLRSARRRKEEEHPK